MKPNLNLVIVEDSATDAELIGRHLSKAGMLADILRRADGA